MMTSGGGRRRRLLRFSAMRPPERSWAPEARAHVGAGAARVGREAARRHIGQRQHHAPDRRLGGFDLGAGHLLEIAPVQHLAVGEGHRRVELDLLLARLVGVAGARLLQRLGEAPVHLLALLLVGQHHLRQHHAEHALQQLGVAPEDVEGLIEELALVAAIDEDRMQRPVEIAAAFDPGGAHGFDRGQHLARPDRQPRRAQRAREIHDVFQEPPAAVRWGRGRGRAFHQPDAASSALTWVKRRSASLPRILAMSS